MIIPLSLSGTETVELIRDVVVIVFLTLGVFVLTVGSVLAVLLYRRASRVLDQAEHAVGRLETVLDSVQGTMDTLSGLAASVKPVLASGFGLVRVARMVRGVLGGGER